MEPDATKTLKRGFFQRLFGKPATLLPEDDGCWTYGDGEVTIELKLAPELMKPGGAIRLEGRDLKNRLLVIHGDDGNYYAFANECTHSNRRLDPVPGAFTIQCCSVGKTTFDYQGNMLAGSGKGPLTTYRVESSEDELTIWLK